MTALLLAWLVTQEWSWQRSPETDVAAYRICVGSTGQAWCAANCVTVPASQCDPLRCWADVPEPPWSPAFVIVTALDDAGNESPTEHGPIGTCP